MKTSLRSVALGLAVVIAGALSSASPAHATGGTGGTLSRTGFKMTGAGAPAAEIHFTSPKADGKAPQLVIVSDASITLTDGYTTNGASTDTPGICSDSYPYGSEGRQIRTCGLLGLGAFTFTGTAAPDTMQVFCSDSAETGCPQPLKILAGGGNDTIATDDDAHIIDISCGAGHDTITKLGPGDTQHSDCEHSPGPCPGANVIAPQHVLATAVTSQKFTVVMTGGVVGIPYREKLGASVTFVTCSNGSIYVHWATHMTDLGRLGDSVVKLDGLSANLQFKTNKGRVLTSTLQWVDGEPFDYHRGAEQSHFDVGAGEYPVKAKFLFYAEKEQDTSVILGVFSRTCTVVAATATSTCKNKNGDNASWKTS